MPGEESSLQMHGQAGKYSSATEHYSTSHARKWSNTHLTILKHGLYKHETPDSE
jgi:hypothetical protein